MGDKENISLKKKRKRTKNTSDEQYLIYLQFMEKDYHFRSGTINPTLGERYIEKKWKELSNLLNAAGNGPYLTVEEWKKRFTDWKYAVRQKYRKIEEHRNKTGSGPEIQIKVTPIEERALAVWGKVVVTGTPLITNYDGIEETSQNFITESMLLIDGEHSQEPNTIEICTENEQLDPIILYVEEGPGSNQLNTPRIQENVVSGKKPAIIKPPGNKRPQPLSELTTQLLQTSKLCETNSREQNEILKQFSENYSALEKQKIEIERFKLKFEVAKFKFENPLFTFDTNIIG